MKFRKSPVEPVNPRVSVLEDLLATANFSRTRSKNTEQADEALKVERWLEQRIAEVKKELAAKAPELAEVGA